MNTRPLGQIVEVAPERVAVFKGQPRKYFAPALMAELEQSIRSIGQQVEIIVKPLKNDPAHSYELVDGERRLRTCLKLKIPVRAIVRDFADEDEQFVTAITVNFARAEHSPLEIAQAIGRLRKNKKIAAITDKAKQSQAIGDIFGRSFTWVYNYESILNLHPRLQTQMNEELSEQARLSARVAMALAQYPHEEQLRLYDEILEKDLTRERAVAYIKLNKGRNATHFDGSKVRDRSVSSLRARLNAAVNLMVDFRASDVATAFIGRPLDDWQSLDYRLGMVEREVRKMREIAAKALGRKAAA